MFWKRKKNSDFISLGLSDYTPPPAPVEELLAPVVETVLEPAPVVIEVAPAPVVVERAPEPVVVKAPLAAPVIVEPVPKPFVPAVASPSEEKEEEAGFFSRFRKAVAATRESLTTKLEDAIKGARRHLQDGEVLQALLCLDLARDCAMQVRDRIAVEQTIIKFEAWR